MILRPTVVCASTVSGGAESYLVRLYSGLKARGHDPSLIGHVPGWAESGLNDVEARLGPKWSGETVIPGLIRLPSEKRRVLTSCGRPSDLFHMQFKREQIGFSGMLARLSPVIWTEHGRWLSGHRGDLLGLAYRRAARSVAAIVCVSEPVADDVQRVVPKRTEISVIENAIDTRLYLPPSPVEIARARLQLGIPPDLPVLAWVGRLHTGKLPHLAVEVGRQWPGTTIVAGTGPEAPQIEARAKATPRVKYLGQLRDASILYRAADVFLFTSKGEGEGFPTTILEAAAHGVPIVANSDSGSAGLTTAAGGLVAATHPDDLASAAFAVLESRVTRAATAREWAQGHDIKSWLDAHEQVFSAVCS